MVDMKIAAPANDPGIITHYRNTLYYIGAGDQRRLSGLRPFQHTYLAKAPGSKMEIGNQKTKVMNTIEVGIVDLQNSR